MTNMTDFTKCPFCHGDENAFVGGNGACECHGTGIMELEPGVGARHLAIDVDRSIFGVTYAPIADIADVARLKTSSPLPMGTRIFTVTQDEGDMERLRNEYGNTARANQSGMSAAASQIQDHLIGAGGRLVVFDKGYTTFDPMRPLSE